MLVVLATAKNERVDHTRHPENLFIYFALNLFEFYSHLKARRQQCHQDTRLARFIVARNSKLFLSPFSGKPSEIFFIRANFRYTN